MSIGVVVARVATAAIRRGLQGWEPVHDVATTVVRIRDVFSARPPLVGMAAHPSSGGDAAYSFPGALHLYLLAVPVEIAGTTWGVLLGMAAIQIAVCVTTLWLLRRLVGERWAIVGAIVLALLVWSIGGDMLIDPRPIAIGVIPLFGFFVAAWAVAEGDGPGLVVFASLGSYLFLNQLVFVVVAPVVGCVAVIGFVGWCRRTRRLRRDDWPTIRRSRTRWGLGALAIVVVAWIPPLIDQFVTGGGNLSQLFRAGLSGDIGSESAGDISPTLTGALGVVASVTAVPRGWLPPSFSRVPFDVHGGGTPFVVGLVWTLALFVVLAGGAVYAHRRGRRVVVSAVVVAIAGWVAYVVTARRNPDNLGYLPRYFLGLWSLGAFLWLVAAICIGTMIAPAVTRRRGPGVVSTGSALVAAVAVVVVLSVWREPPRPWIVRDVQSTANAARVRDAASRAPLDGGPVLVETGVWAPSLRRYFPSVLLGLQDAGVPFRVRSTFDVEQFGAGRRDRGDHSARIRLSRGDEFDDDEELLITVRPEPGLDPDRFDDIGERILAGVAGGLVPAPGLRLQPRQQVILDKVLADLERTHGDAAESLVRDDEFLALLSGFGLDPDVELVHIPGVSRDEQYLWAAEIKRRRGKGTVNVFLRRGA